MGAKPYLKRVSSSFCQDCVTKSVAVKGPNIFAQSYKNQLFYEVNFDFFDGAVCW